MLPIIHKDVMTKSPSIPYQNPISNVFEAKTKSFFSCLNNNLAVKHADSLVDRYKKTTDAIINLISCI